MTNFPTAFTEAPRYIECTGVRARDAMPFLELAHRGLIVVAGVRRSDVPGLSAITEQEGVREYCPQVLEHRWTDEAAAEAQLAKDGGLAVFRLESQRTGETAAFGFAGRSSDEERSHLPACENTLALCVSEKFQGKKLAAPFTRAVVAGAMALYGARNIGATTWGSNTPAVRTCLRAGAQLVTTQDSERPTRIQAHRDANGNRRDVRMYVQFPQSA